MAERAVPIKLWPAAAAVLALSLGPVVVVALWADRLAALSPPDWSAIRFTVLQALLSAALSILLAIPIARALARRRFPGRSVFITLLGAPFVLPALVAVIGLLAVFGRNGVVSRGLEAFGAEPISIYGLTGVVLAHVFFNLPLATRFLLQGWAAVPAERFRLAASLGIDGPAFRRLFEWPMIRAVAPGAALVIFMICLSSFAVALTLGGGPRATTIELAIYQAFRFEFDLGHAALLALAQVSICVTVAALSLWVWAPSRFGGGLDRLPRRFDGRTPLALAWDVLALGLAAVFLIAPLLAVLLPGLVHVVDLPATVYLAATRSVGVAMASALLAIALALWMIETGGRGRRGAALSALPLAVSPLVLGTGIFLIVRPFGAPQDFALPLTALVNAVLALPFVWRILEPSVREVDLSYGRLMQGLGLSWWSRMQLIVLPRVARPLGFAAGLAAAFSMGDFGVIAFFAGADNATLPLELYRLIGAYRMDQAAGAATLLLWLALALFWICDRGGRMNAKG